MLILLKVPSFWRHTTFLHVLVVYSAGLAKPAGLAMEIFNSLEERATDKEICVGREGLPYRNGRQWWKCQVGHNVCFGMLIHCLSMSTSFCDFTTFDHHICDLCLAGAVVLEAKLEGFAASSRAPNQRAS